MASEAEQLRAAVLAIVQGRGAKGIGTGSLIDQLHRQDFQNLRNLWRLRDVLLDEGLIEVRGPSNRQRWYEAEAAPQPELPRPARETRPPRRPKRLAIQPRSTPWPAQRPRPEPAPEPGPPPPPPPPPPVALSAPEPAPPLPAPPKRTPPRLLPKTTRHKNITRLDHPERSQVGYMVRVFWQKQRRQAFFSDKKYGDQLAALHAALEWRKKVEQELGKPRSENPALQPVRTNTKVRGVRLEARGKAPYFIARWREDGKVRSAAFAINKYGKRRALALARKAYEAAMVRREQAELARRAGESEAA